MKIFAHDRGSPIAGIAMLIAMLMITFTAVIATPDSTTNDDFTAISAVDLTNDITISPATMATPTAKYNDKSPASTDATRATFDDMTLTASTASPPAVISTDEYFRYATIYIGTTAANPELTNLGYDDGRSIDMNRATYSDDGVHRLLTRSNNANPNIPMLAAEPQNESPRGVSRRLTRLGENSFNPDAAIVIKI